MTDRELMQQALDALIKGIELSYSEYANENYFEPVVKSLRARLAQPEPEPVAWMFPDDLERFQTSETFAQAFSIACGSPTQGKTLPLYTAPPQREPESILNSLHCNCGASWTFKDGALEYKPSKRENNND